MEFKNSFRHDLRGKHHPDRYHVHNVGQFIARSPFAAPGRRLLVLSRSDATTGLLLRGAMHWKRAFS